MSVTPPATAILFPGHGSHVPGMDEPVAREDLETAQTAHSEETSDRALA
jgi:hypothetical protein